MTLALTEQLQQRIEFLTLYKQETKQSDTWLKQRIQQAQERDFSLTTDELTYGARVAWRNSNKCIGRLFWNSLTVFDRRELLEPQQIFEALVTHIDFATNGGKIRPAISVFDPTRVRIWNHQLIRYAGYETEVGIIGDSDSLDFTKVCEQLGWHGERTNYDVLPLVIQVDDSVPQVFEIPKEALLEVTITHPDYDFSQLNMQWYAVPIISNMRFNIAGVDYQAAPFNGWYMGTEIGARNLADDYRYNFLPDVALVMGLDTSRNASLWKDRALVELNLAVLHSYKQAGVSIVDHHTAAQQFLLFQQQEQESEREVTGNWVWLVPPLSPATTSIYHQPIDNTLKKPNYLYQTQPY
ncbi:nitric oxide synthase oxygenase [Solibacillus daqui]|uniref:nitric oxide synthase oxygenase n=1 Tax=Solibacillus daqui TaxID=2912187 RepID=UPI0023665BE8|nr:nitric oxide synthase oxygenase [Solibacillus daqui]